MLLRRLFKIKLFRFFLFIWILCNHPFIARGEDSLDTLKMIDINRNVVDFAKMKDKPILLIFFDPTNITNKESISYAQVLYHRYKSKGFEAIGISSQDTSSTKELFFYGGFSLPFVSDAQSTIYERFKMKSCCGGIILFNRKHEIVFQMSYLLKPENLRQIVEKEIFGKISYVFSKIDYIDYSKWEKNIIHIPLFDIAANKVTDLGSIERKPLIATFMSSFCPACKSAIRIETLKRIHNDMSKYGWNAHFIIVFSKPYTDRDILEIGKIVDIPFDKYVSFEDVFNEDEKYITDAAQKADPKTIVCNKYNEIEYIERIGTNEKEISARLESILKTK